MSNFEGVLPDLAHTKGIKSLSVELIQAPNADNGMTAICKATVVMANEVSYTDIGDASQTNVNDLNFMSCVIRVASTRSKTTYNNLFLS